MVVPSRPDTWQPGLDARAPLRQVLDANMPEDDFLAAVRDLAVLRGWRWYHPYDSRRSPYGYPDCTLVRPPRLVFCELKRASGHTTRAQQDWLDLLGHCPGVEAYLWHPSDWTRIEEILR